MSKHFNAYILYAYIQTISKLVHYKLASEVADGYITTERQNIHIWTKGPFINYYLCFQTAEIKLLGYSPTIKHLVDLFEVKCALRCFVTNCERNALLKEHSQKSLKEITIVLRSTI